MIPSDYNLPFDSFRPGQLQTAQALSEETGHAILRTPPGRGKTLIYILSALMSARRSDHPFRTLILTSTRRLQDQLMKDFRSIGLVDIRGMDNYPCVAMRPEGFTCAEGPCLTGQNCLDKDTHCEYYSAVRRAIVSPLVVTSYAYYLHRCLNGHNLGQFDLLICDEAHLALDWLTKVLSFQVEFHLFYRLTGLAVPRTTDSRTIDTWAPLAHRALQKAYRSTQNESERKGIAHLGKSFRRMIDDTNLWTTDQKKTALEISPVWPDSHILFQHAHRSILCSATVYQSDARHLELVCTEHVLPSDFPVDNRPIVLVDKEPEVRLSRNTSPAELRILCDRMGAFIDNTPHHKGIIQCTSYALAKQIRDTSRDPSRFLLATRSDSKLDQFANSSNGVLISPSVKEGVDFPYDNCRFVLFPKVPFPYLGDPVTKARRQTDKSYLDNLARRSFVQMALRAVRASDDYCIILLFDGHFSWWLDRIRFEPWFAESFSRAKSVPSIRKDM
jgi:Rad3-related DNA helicase